MDFIHLPGVPAGDGCFTYSMGSSHAGTEPFLPYSYELELKTVRKPNPLGTKSHHQRCNSEINFLEKPPWFDDLLNEPENLLISSKGHRRSASDSTYISALEYNTRSKNKEKNKLENCIIPFEPWNSADYGGVSIEKTRSFPDLENIGEPSLGSEICSNGIDGNSLENSDSSFVTSKKNDAEEDIASQNQEGVCKKNNMTQPKPSIVKGEDKRAKQCRQSAHRSRIRKLQYIADLERNIQVLQVEGSEFSAALEFLDQQKFILCMENRALQQRLDSLSQEHMIKHMEQEMLEREIGRLRAIYQLQMQQQPKHHRKKNRDQLNAQLAQALYHN